MTRKRSVPFVVDLVAGTRPNFVKLAPVERALRAFPGLVPKVVHTGQHYDVAMNDVFFEELGIPEPAVHLGVGSGSHGQQTARILERYEECLLKDPPAATVVFGDVNSTVACALAAVKLGIPVIHVEAGLRSFDRTMPEEINRLLTDAIADLLLVSEPSGVENLRREGITEDKIALVGNVMIDTVAATLNKMDGAAIRYRGLEPGAYGLVTLHRPSNVDNPIVLASLLRLFAELSAQLPLVFPIHPRTRRAVETAGLVDLLEHTPGLHCLPALAYGENLALMRAARLVLTDSGGMQEETTFLKVPCLTMRDNTERPVTIKLGTSRLVGNNPARIWSAFRDVMAGAWPGGEDVPLWDGRAAERVAALIDSWLSNRGKASIAG